MNTFAAGYIAAIATYLAIGAVFGTVAVWQNMARFFSAGFQYKRMMKHIGTLMVFWPGAVWELI